MSWEIHLAAKAQKDLLAIRGHDRALVNGRLLILELNPRSFGAIPLKGSPYYRARTGDWRLIYQINDSAQVVLIIRILRRSEKTYRDF